MARRELSQNLKVLLVDDEEKVLGALRRSLLKVEPQLDLQVARGGDDAIKVCEEQDFDLVISDLRMPRTDGNRVLGYIRRNQPDSFRVILSGQASVESLFDSLIVSHQYLEKPCPSNRITNLITALQNIRNSLLPASLIHQIITLSSFACDGSIVNLLKDQIQAGVPAQKLNSLFCSDLAISIGLLRLTAITCGGSLPAEHPLDASNLSTTLLEKLLVSRLLVPLFESEDLLRAIRLTSIKSTLLRHQLKNNQVTDSRLLGVLGYAGELALIQALGTESEMLKELWHYRDQITEVLWTLWAMPEALISELKKHEFINIRNQIDNLFPLDEIAKISNAEVLEIYSEVICLTD